MDHVGMELEQKELQLLRNLWNGGCNATDKQALRSFYQRLRDPGVSCVPMDKKELSDYLRKTMETFWNRDK